MPVVCPRRPLLRRGPKLACQRLGEAADPVPNVLDFLTQLGRHGLTQEGTILPVEAVLQAGDLTDHVPQLGGIAQKAFGTLRQIGDGRVPGAHLRSYVP